MTIFVQVTGCFCDDETGDTVPFVSNEDADFYGVYVGEPGVYEWQADFLHYEDAMVYAMAIHKHHGYAIDDKTFNEGDFNGTSH
jgi:hypothetical protein